MQDETEPYGTPLDRALGQHRAGAFDDAEALYRQVLATEPGNFTALANLGAVLHARGRFEEAIGALTEACRLEPARADTLRNLSLCIADWGLQVQHSGHLGPAIALYRKALALDPALLHARNNLGAALLQQGQVAEAIEQFRAAIALDPTSAPLQFNLGNALRDQGALDGAVASYRAALALDPRHADAAINLGSALLDQGAPAAALACYRQGIALAPDTTAPRSNALMCLAYDPAQSAADLLDAARAVGRRLGTAAPMVARDRDPERRLRVGYVSADFRFHPVGWFIQAPLRHHDRARVELFCYADQDETDGLTEQLRGAVEHWRPIKDLPDDALAAQIAADRIDILIELAGHSAHNRLPALARRLAPVQASWIGFPMTTGVGAIDHLIADAVLAPPDADADFSEAVVRLPAVGWCYTPPGFAPPVAPLPALAAGVVTFGSFNNPVKLNAAVLADWAEILARVAGSRLLIKFRHLQGGEAAARLRAAATAAGIASDRLILEGAAPHPEALAAYGRVDIALDPFPFNGGTTTCEALWMGVPVVTFPGATMAGRMGASFVAAAGLPELVARDRADQVARAIALAGDLDRLAALRVGLRAGMAASPLCDGPRFAGDLEAALRTIWRRHCAGTSA